MGYVVNYYPLSARQAGLDPAAPEPGDQVYATLAIARSVLVSTVEVEEDRCHPLELAIATARAAVAQPGEVISVGMYDHWIVEFD